MAWSTVGSLGATQSKVADNKIVHVTTAEALAGTVVTVGVALDNVGTTDANHAEVTSVVDSAGNTYDKDDEITNGQGAANAGVTIAAFRSLLTTTLPLGGTIQANFANTVSAKAITAFNTNVGAGSTVALAASASLLEDAATDTGSLDVATAAAEFLRVRYVAKERAGAPTYTPTAGWTAGVQAATSGGAAETNIGICCEVRVVTGTGAPSDPTWTQTTACDWASLYVALEETPAGGGGGGGGHEMLLMQSGDF